MRLSDESALLDIAEAARNVVRVANHLDMARFSEDRDWQATVQYYLIVLGEATKRLSAEFREQHPGVQWSAVAGLRDVLVHAYDRIDAEQIWGIANESTPALLAYIEPLLPEPPDA